jgi:hypothetical protein
MSLLPPHAIEEFQLLRVKHYGVELSREEASREEASREEASREEASREEASREEASARAYQVVTLVRLTA